MKKFGTPIGAVPGVANENDGFDGVVVPPLPFAGGGLVVVVVLDVVVVVVDLPPLPLFLWWFDDPPLLFDVGPVDVGA
jgi:hypothetical protein